MLAGALVRVAPHDKLVGVVWVFGDVQDRVENHIGRVFGLITVGTAHLSDSPEVGTEGVLKL